MKTQEILSILRCPVSNMELELSNDGNQLISIAQGNVFDVKDGIPVFLREDFREGRKINYLEHYTLDGEYFDYFKKRERASFEAERRLREYILSLIPKKSELILDIGSGSAWLAKQIDKNKRIISLDISLNNIKKALSDYPFENHYGVVGDAYHLSFADNSFDCIVAAEIIEHLETPAAFIEQAIKKLKKNGTLIISTPYKERISQYLCIHCNKLTPQNAHLHSFDENKLKALVKDEVKSIEFFTFGNKFHTFLRFYIIMKYFNFRLWKLIDSAFSILINKKINIILRIVK